MPRSPEMDVVLADLRDTSRPFSVRHLYHLSDLGQDDLRALESAWPDLPVDRRLDVVQMLAEIGEANFEVTFDRVYLLALDDEAAEVRAAAIGALWESDDPRLVAPFLDAMQHDPSVEVRAAAASGLGRFVYLGEVEEIPELYAQRAVDALLAVVQGADDLEVRRRALEAVGFSGRQEVSALIDAAYAAPDRRLKLSALCAMGRTANSERWGAAVATDLASPDAETRFEAARAAGELELRSATRVLGRLAREADPQVRDAAIWSLGQIGGEEARRLLDQLRAQTVDEDLQDYIDEALENMDFSDDARALQLLDIEEAEPDDLEEIDDLEEYLDSEFVDALDDEADDEDE